LSAEAGLFAKTLLFCPDRSARCSRGGLTTKVHALVDANGLPLDCL
jgi:hypothetical protein